MDHKLLEDLIDRVAEIEKDNSMLFKESALAGKSLEVVNNLMNTIDNHVHSLTQNLLEYNVRLSLLEQKISSFSGMFKWMFPSVLALIALVGAFVTLIATGKLVFA